MADDITEVTKEILPGEKLDCVAYGCTSGKEAYKMLENAAKS